MPPKRNNSFSKLKALNLDQFRANNDKGKQVTISKFFASSSTKRKTEEKTDETIVIDGTIDERDNVKEKTVSSPLKKKLKLDKVDKVNGITDKTTSEQNTVSEVEHHDVSENISNLLKRTKAKLELFSVTEDSQRMQSVKTFDFNSLKREKAKYFADNNETISEENHGASTSNDLGDDINVASTYSNIKHDSKRCGAKFSKFSSRVSGKREAGSPKIGGGVKYTQLEQQFVEIKEKYPDTVLFVECGYKYRFFGNDAEIAAEVLKIYCHLDHNFMTASIPVYRLFVHVRRLVSAGYKVGVVKQTETAALKAAGSTKSALFTRQLTALYTKSTLIGEDVEGAGGREGPSVDQSGCGATNYLMCVCDGLTDKDSKEKTIGIVAVQLSSGEIVYDSFEDKETRSELETRLAHLQPVEVLMSKGASPATDRLLTGLQTVSLTADDRMRLEHLDQSVFEYSSAFRLVSDFYQTEGTTAGVQLQEIVHLPKPVLCCLAALITYLRDFNLEKILLEVRNFTQFSTKSKYMELNSCSLRNLEIFQNSTNGRERGSLFWALNQTVSKAGAQMFRSWLSRPLMDYNDIMARQTAVADILGGNFPDWRKIRGLLSGLPDLQKALTAVYHKKSGTADFYNMCRSLQRVYEEFSIQKEALSGQITSDLLREVIQEVPELLSDVSEFINALVEKSAKENDKTRLFSDESKFPSIVKSKDDIQCVLQNIHDHRREIRLTVKQPSLEYTTVSGTEFLIEVKNNNLSLVPKTWTKISSTKAVSRFHSPYIVSQYKLLQQNRETLEIVCQQAWQDFLDQFVCKYQCYRRAVQLVATLDCLFSLACVAQTHGYCRPEILKDGVSVEIEAGRHPVIEELLGEGQQYVPNDTHLKESGQRVMIVTGPNMGGKSSYIKQVAIIAIMAQIGAYVPAESARLGILDAVHTRAYAEYHQRKMPTVFGLNQMAMSRVMPALDYRALSDCVSFLVWMGAMDEIFTRRSTFMVELQEAADIMAKVTSRSLVILDELGRGTSTHDGTAIAHATLQFFITEPKCVTLFVTHYPLLAEFEKTYPEIVGNFHMSFMVHDQQYSDTDKVTFLYQLVKGAAERSYGLNVASLAQVPDSVVKVASEKSHELEELIRQQREHKRLLQRLFSKDCTNYRDLLTSVT